MKDLIENILKNITTHPDKVVIEQSQEEGVDVYTITVDPEDMGRVIGKSGKVIRAIRTLTHVAGIRSEKRVRVTLAETETGAPPISSETPDTETTPTKPQETPAPEVPSVEETLTVETPVVEGNLEEPAAESTKPQQPAEEPTA